MQISESGHHLLSSKMAFKINSSYTLTHLYFAVTQTNGTIGESRKSTPSPPACSLKTIRQTPANPSSCGSALSPVRLNPNPNSTHTSILTLLQHFFISGRPWSQEAVIPLLGEILDQLRLRDSGLATERKKFQPHF